MKKGDTKLPLHHEHARHLFNNRDIIHQEFVAPGQIINEELRENIWRKKRHLWHVVNWILHDKSAPCHQALLAWGFLNKHSTLSLPYPLHFPNVASAEFFLFLKMKAQLNGLHFNSFVELRRELHQVLGSLMRDNFRATFQNSRNAGTNALLQKRTPSEETVLKIKQNLHFLKQCLSVNFLITRCVSRLQNDRMWFNCRFLQIGCPWRVWQCGDWNVFPCRTLRRPYHAGRAV